MIEVKVNHEIKKIKSKIYFGMTGFQFGFLAAGLILGVVASVLLPFPMMFNSYVILFIVGIFAFVAFFTYNGMSIFMLVKAIIKNLMITSRPLIYESREGEGKKYEYICNLYSRKK